MPDSPRFSEDDINAIFQEAIRAQEEARGLGRRDGLSLDELHEIGAELGISPEFITRAAAARRTPITAKPDRRIIGIPISVERVVELPRAITDDEWGRIVADLRQTFDARGKVSEAGTLRQWTNGNLSAMLEPSDDGWQLRLRTLKGSAAPRIGVSGALALFGALLLTLLYFKTNPQDPSKYVFGFMYFVAAAGLAGFTAASTKAWHRERSEQMDALARRVSAMVVGAEPVASGESSRAEVAEANASVEQQTKTSTSRIDPSLIDTPEGERSRENGSQRARG